MADEVAAGFVSEEEVLAPDLPPNRRWWAWRLVVLAAFFIMWDRLVVTGLLSARLFARPWDVVSWMVDWVATGAAWPHLSITLDAAIRGYVLGLIAGAVVAGTFVAVPLIADVFDPFMAVINGIPKVVIAPLIILIFGLGLASKVVLAAILVFFVSFFNLYSGLRSVDRGLIANLHVLGAKRRHLLLDLYIPAIFAWAFSTLRVGIGFALIGVIVGEFVGAVRGVGWTIKVAGEQNIAPQLLGGLAMLGVIAWVIEAGLSRVERRYQSWSVL